MFVEKPTENGSQRIVREPRTNYTNTMFISVYAALGSITLRSMQPHVFSITIRSGVKSYTRILNKVNFI